MVFQNIVREDSSTGWGLTLSRIRLIPVGDRAADTAN